MAEYLLSTQEVIHGAPLHESRVPGRCGSGYALWELGTAAGVTVFFCGGGGRADCPAEATAEASTVQGTDDKVRTVLGASATVGDKMDCRDKGACTGQAKQGVPQPDETHDSTDPTGFLGIPDIPEDPLLPAVTK